MSHHEPPVTIAAFNPGERELHEVNAAPFGFDAASIDVVLLTHAHLDHCGRLRLLVKRGFKGEIITTTASRELARIMLLDSVHLHEAGTQPTDTGRRPHIWSTDSIVQRTNRIHLDRLLASAVQEHPTAWTVSDSFEDRRPSCGF